MFALGLVALAAAGCLRGKKFSDVGREGGPRATGEPAWRVPPGVVVAPEARGATEIDGLYPSTVPNDLMCCWTGMRARVLTRKPAFATSLHLTVYVPDYPFFARHPQALSVAIGGAPAETRCCYKPGVYTLDFALPARLQARAGTVPVTIVARQAFVPVREGVNADTRALGIVLVRVDYRSAASILPSAMPSNIHQKPPTLG